MSRKLPTPLAARPIAAQYGVCAHSCGNNSARVSRPEPARRPMIVQRRVAFVLAPALLGSAAQAAELPSQRHADKPAQAEAAKKCNVAGSAGIQAANGVCVRVSGYVSSQFGAGQLK